MTSFRRLWPQPALACTALAAGLGSVAAAWLIAGSTAVGGDPVAFATLAGALALVLVATYPIAIHVRQNTKTQITTVLVYLLVVLVPVPLAVTGVLLAVCIGELRVRAARGTYLSDIATQTGRWAACAVVASLVAHAGAPGTTARAAGVVAAAGVLWLGDMVTLPALLYPINGERPATVIRGFLRDAGALEAALYVLGILGVQAAHQGIWWLTLLVLPVTAVHLVARHGRKMQQTTAPNFA